MKKKMLIEGMMCAHCKAAVEKALSAIPGVASCEVNLAEKTAVITLTVDVADAVLMEAVRAIDFEPVQMLSI